MTRFENDSLREANIIARSKDWKNVDHELAEHSLIGLDGPFGQSIFPYAS
jgi:hypothetical protein